MPSEATARPMTTAAGRATRRCSATGPSGRAANQGHAASRANDSVATTVCAADEPAREGRGMAATARVATPPAASSSRPGRRAGTRAHAVTRWASPVSTRAGRHDPAVRGRRRRERADRLGAGVEPAGLHRGGPGPATDQRHDRDGRAQHRRARPSHRLARGRPGPGRARSPVGGRRRGRRLARGLGHAHHPRSVACAPGPVARRPAPAPFRGAPGSAGAAGICQLLPVAGESAAPTGRRGVGSTVSERGGRAAAWRSPRHTRTGRC